MILSYLLLIFTAQAINGFDWNCYEAPITKELNCFVKDTPEASALPIHSTITGYGCGKFPKRPSIKYVKVKNGEKTCEQGTLCSSYSKSRSNAL